MSIQRFTAIIEGDAETGYFVFFPDLPGLTSYGETIEQAAAHARGTLTSHLRLRALDPNAGPVPNPRRPEDIGYNPDAQEAARILVPIELAERPAAQPGPAGDKARAGRPAARDLLEPRGTGMRAVEILHGGAWPRRWRPPTTPGP